MYCRIWNTERNGVEVPVSIDVILRNLPHLGPSLSRQLCSAPQQCSNKIILDTMTKARPIIALSLDGGRQKPEHPGFGRIQILRDRLTVSSGRTGSNHGPILATSRLKLRRHPVKGSESNLRQTLFPVSWSNPLQQSSFYWIEIMLDQEEIVQDHMRTWDTRQRWGM